MKTYLITLGALLALCAVVTGCDIGDRRTTLEIVDAERHYYPVVRGQMLDIVYHIWNTGKHPLFVDDIKTSCGCVVVDKSFSRVLPPGGKGFLKMTYDSKKNIGYVKHYVAIYGNLVEGDMTEVSFDLNVVPDALYTHDYEELYDKYKRNTLDVKDLVDGNENNMGYYMEDIPW